MIRRVACFAGALFLLGLSACKDEDPHPPAAGEPPTAQPFGNTGGSGGGTIDNGTGSSSGTVPTGTDAGLDGATGTTCTDLALTGVVVDEEAVAQDPPAATGGTLGNGTYNLTQVTKYIGATGTNAGLTGVTYQSTIRITNGTTFERDTVLATNATAGTEQRSIGIMVPTTPNLTITFNCPTQTQEQYTYSVTNSSSFTLTNATTRESYTYVLKL